MKNIYLWGISVLVIGSIATSVFSSVSNVAQLVPPGPLAPAYVEYAPPNLTAVYHAQLVPPDPSPVVYTSIV